jgi:hypothetical protein
MPSFKPEKQGEKMRSFFMPPLTALAVKVQVKRAASIMAHGDDDTYNPSFVRC